MAISITEHVKVQLYSPLPPYEDKYPCGFWKAARKQTGDATGGQLTLLIASISASESAKYAWSLEEISSRVPSLATEDITIFIVPAEPYVDEANNVNIELLGFSTSIRSSLSGYSGLSLTAVKPFCRYVWRPGNGLTWSMTIAHSNPGVGTDAYHFAWGYVWHQQVFTLAGGPRRP